MVWPIRVPPLKTEAKAPLLSPESDESEDNFRGASSDNDDEDWRERTLDGIAVAVDETSDTSETPGELEIDSEPGSPVTAPVARRKRQWLDVVLRKMPFQVPLRSGIEEEIRLSMVAKGRLNRLKNVMSEEKIVQIDVLAAGNLTDEPDLVHPIVRVHIVDATTGRYIPKMSTNATTTHEQCRILGLRDQSKPVDTVLPVATKPAHLTDKCVAPVWNDSFVVDIPFGTLLNPEILILFEIADFRHIQSTQKGRDGLYGLAWAFLRPVGPGGKPLIGAPDWLPDLDGWYDEDTDNDSTTSAEDDDSEDDDDEKDSEDEKEKDSDDDETEDDDDKKKVTKKKKKKTMAGKLFRETSEEEKKEEETEKKKVYEEHAKQTVRLQLYEWSPLSRRAMYEAKERQMFFPPAPASPEVPAVYLQWLRARWRPGRTTLLVRVLGIPRPAPRFVWRRPTLPMETETATGDFSLPRNRRQKKKKTPPDARADKATARARLPSETCVFPERLLCRLNPAKLGASVVRFSPVTGRLLGVGGCEENGIFPVRVYDVAACPRDFPYTSDAPLTAAQAAESFGAAANTQREQTAILVADLHGHHGTVYDLRFTNDDKLLLSAAADGSAKLWDLGGLACLAKDDVTKIAPSLIADFYHDAPFIYCAAFVAIATTEEPETVNPLGNEGTLDLLGATAKRVITGAFDGGVRLWDIQEEEPMGLLSGEIQHEAHVNVMDIDMRSRRIFTGDALGIVVMWTYDESGSGSDLDDYKVLRRLAHPLFHGTPIVSLSLHPRRRRGQLLIQAHGSKLALVDLTTNGLVASYKGSPCKSFLRAILSPDGMIILSGGDDGRLSAWHAATGQRIRLPPVLDDLQFTEPLRDVTWNPVQHVIALTCFGGDHPVLIFAADRPPNPQTILPASDTSHLRLDLPDRSLQRRRRIRELQERRRQLQARQS